MRSKTFAVGLLAALAGSSAAPSYSFAQAAELVSADRLVLPAPKAGRSRPLVVVVAENGGAETTDFTVPLGVLRDAGVADVRSLSTAPGPVQLLRSLRIVADQTVAQFDSAEPAGADIVIIPAQAAPDDPALRAWVQAQSAKGAIIVSICEGARVLAGAGLLKGKRAVTHWSAMEELADAHPDTTWVRDRRYVQDGRIISTSGVTASIPVSLALVEAIGGHAVASTTAKRFGVEQWDATHRTSDFKISTWDIARAVMNLAAVWNHEKIEAPIADGVDEVALALRTDAWNRSYKTTMVTTRSSREPVVSRHGLTILPDESPKPGRYVLPVDFRPAVPQLDTAISEMARRYGPFEVRMAVVGMEYDIPNKAAR
jgi:transcriptional regulator GlxA family with amidase domain